MKAIFCEKYGPPEVLKIHDIAKPEPKPDQVLIKVFASTANSGDARIRALRVPAGLGPLVRIKLGFSRPKQPIFGFDLSGEIVAVGSQVTKFKVGDRVIASNGFNFGCHAEFVVLAEDAAIAPIPENIDYAGAVSLCFGGTTALVFFDECHLARGEKILINGASGAVGTLAIQAAKHIGAEVTAVCSGANLDLVKSLGADHVIDYTKQDFTNLPERYDVIMDNHGNAPYARTKHLLKPGGRFLLIIGGLLQMIQGAVTKAIITGDDGAINAKMYARLMALAKQGALKPVIDKIYPMDQIVKAHRYIDTGHKKGSLVITFNDEG